MVFKTCTWRQVIIAVNFAIEDNKMCVLFIAWNMWNHILVFELCVYLNALTYLRNWYTMITWLIKAVYIFDLFFAFHYAKTIEHEKKKIYLSPILNRGFFGALGPAFALWASPNFSVTTHSFTLPVSNRPIKVALVRCRDMTFSKRIQKNSKWTDLQDQMTNMIYKITEI